MTEKREHQVTDEQAMTDVYDTIRTTLEVHAENKNMEHVSMDFNLASRNEKEDKFLRKHMEILHQVNRVFDIEKVNKLYKVRTIEGEKIEGIRGKYMPSIAEQKKMKERITELQKRTMMQLRNDMNMVNIIARNKDGELYKTILNAIAEGSKKEINTSSLEKIPLLGGLFKRETDEGTK